MGGWLHRWGISDMKGWLPVWVLTFSLCIWLLAAVLLKPHIHRHIEPPTLTTEKDGLQLRHWGERKNWSCSGVPKRMHPDSTTPIPPGMQASVDDATDTALSREASGSKGKDPIITASLGSRFRLSLVQLYCHAQRDNVYSWKDPNHSIGQSRGLQRSQTRTNLTFPFPEES